MRLDAVLGGEDSLVDVDCCMEALVHCGAAAFDAGPACDIAGCVVGGGVGGAVYECGAIYQLVLIPKGGVDTCMVTWIRS